MIRLIGALVLALSPFLIHADYNQEQQIILNDINAYRATRHLAPLTLNPIISEAAIHHSKAMATHQRSFGHEGFNQRIQALFKQFYPCNGGAENIAYGYKDGHDVVKNWLTSPHHRANIEGSYDLTGIGLAQDRHHKFYFTQIFVRKT